MQRSVVAAPTAQRQEGKDMPTKMIHLVGFVGALVIWGCPISWFWFHKGGVALSCLVTGGVLLAIGAHEILTRHETTREMDRMMARTKRGPPIKSDPILPPLG
jgi:hypothetical protein